MNNDKKNKTPLGGNGIKSRCSRSWRFCGEKIFSLNCIKLKYKSFQAFFPPCKRLFEYEKCLTFPMHEAAI